MYLSTNDIQQFPFHLRALIEEELEYRERIDWAGKPIPKRFALRSIPIVLFAIPWTAFSIFWIAGAAGFEIPDFNKGFDLFPLFGIPFLLIGFGMLSSPLFMIYKAKRTAYIVTTSRAIIFDGGFATTIRSFDFDRLSDLRRKQRVDGFGDLIFERKTSYDTDGGIQNTDYGFLAISNVKEAERVVRKLVDKSANEKA